MNYKFFKIIKSPNNFITQWPVSGRIYNCQQYTP